ncbi:ribonuclease P protein component [Nocardia huaxiensis]|uniref:Ribonuclease P protein component n=1 Tax=Nocardia huaxiensis TaxID=2755382 RepID=A0A7D6V9M8_9NOCA|nr:ribonuclease P protein component [Nocardia huaxiensis]QLY31061.1 ribonuclease P protein component [Nocardia huaxiensis]UFS94586.1 ribonuclease P protein component [Nocardia huaxiensis]
MLPEPFRLHRRTDFSRTVRQGRRIGRRDLVVHVLLHDDRTDTQTPAIRTGGPRFGLIVSKAVGPAVVRHRVARRLRHICASLAGELPDGADIVIRALPGAADAPSAELERQMRSGIRKLGATDS